MTTGRSDATTADPEANPQAVPDLREVSVAVSIEALLERSEPARVEDVRLGTFLDRTVVRLYRDRDRVEMYDAASGATGRPDIRHLPIRDMLMFRIMQRTSDSGQ